MSIFYSIMALVAARCVQHKGDVHKLRNRENDDFDTTYLPPVIVP